MNPARARFFYVIDSKGRQRGLRFPLYPQYPTIEVPPFEPGACTVVGLAAGNDQLPYMYMISDFSHALRATDKIQPTLTWEGSYSE